ncbi:acyl carrier protein [Cyclobacterium xiamenense]|uniref:acyl carrier protein n=1 Tax=Cyclobacterium xiamenense TaxID=1297121 RepID=UPI0012B8FE4B|nr:phosphopantetheine-binding protein [Cyclobacterium xiamenense]
MKATILEVFNTIIENRGNKKLESISPEMHLKYDIGFDSLDLAELTVRIEADYDIDIFEDGIVNTVGEILKKLEKK